MIIEFIGSTGSGKSTLIAAVQRQLAAQARVITAFELVATALGLSHISHPTLRNLIQDLASIPFFVGSLFRHRVYIVYVIWGLIRYRKNTLFTLNYLRSIVRKIGMYEIAKRYSRDRIVIVDEGTVMTAHLLFVFTTRAYDRQDVNRFAELVPLPDAIVYLTAPVDELVRRTQQRHDAPRELRNRMNSALENDICRAAQMFDHLVATERIRQHVVTVANDDSRANARTQIAERLAATILYKLSDSSSSAVAADPAIQPATRL